MTTVPAEKPNAYAELAKSLHELGDLCATLADHAALTDVDKKPFVTLSILPGHIGAHRTNAPIIDAVAQALVGKPGTTTTIRVDNGVSHRAEGHVGPVRVSIHGQVPVEAERAELAALRAEVAPLRATVDLHPTPNRLAVLREVDARRVFRDTIGDSYISGERKVNFAIAEMQQAGWVELDPPPPGSHVALPEWRLTDAGRAVLAADATAAGSGAASAERQLGLTDTADQPAETSGIAR